MRWGIFSDVHANLEALRAVLESFSQERIDAFACVGDIVGYGANPSECIEEVKKYNPIIVAGNHDWAVCEKIDASNFNPRAYEAVKWTSNAVTCEDKQYLAKLPLVRSQEDITFVHGSLTCPEEFAYVSSERSAYYTLQACHTQLCIVGHSHVPFIFVMDKEIRSFSAASHFQLKRSGRYLINAGSVGQPRDGNAQAAYVIFDSEENEITIKRVAYDVERAMDKIIKAGLPSAFAMRLSMGR